GRVRLYHGRPKGLKDQPAWVRDGGQEEMRFGWAITGLSDVDGDGFTDVAVGAPGWTNGEPSEGRVVLFLGDEGSLPEDADWKVEGDGLGHTLGFSLCDAGDVDGDGFADLATGAPSNETPWWSSDSFGAAATVWRGAPGFPAGKIVFDGPKVLPDGYAWSLGAGDLNGDGLSDLVIGFPFAGSDDDEDAVGRILVESGRAGVHAPGSPRLRRLDDAAPIVTGGVATDGGFRVVLDLATPFGRGFAGIEVEVESAGVPFDGEGTVVVPFADVEAGEDALAAVVSGLADGEWRWRARRTYEPATVPWLPAGPWTRPSDHATSLPDVRTGPAFCGAEAQSEAYGGGKAGSAGLPVLSGSGLPRPGAVVELRVEPGVPGVAPSLLIGLAPLASPFDGGTLLVQPTVTVALPPFTSHGAVTVDVPLPADAALCGVEAFFQAMFVDPNGAGPLGTAQTNGLRWRIGL
ncbi:MAG: hypothetical protein ACF8XB_08440, partial [Planctomycetota bacterium JB042]